MKLLTLTLALLFATAVPPQRKFELNHLYMVVDDETYVAIAESQFLQDFCYLEQTGKEQYIGMYLYGTTNFIEFFHTRSMNFDSMSRGTAGISFTSMKQGALKSVEQELAKEHQLDPEDDDFYHSIFLPDHPVYPLTIWTSEFHKKGFKAKTAKKCKRKQWFQSADYNKYDQTKTDGKLFKDVAGIEMIVHPEVSGSLMHYIALHGYHYDSEKERYTNGKTFFIIHESVIASRQYVIQKIHLNLLNDTPSADVKIGNTHLHLERLEAVWSFDTDQ